MSSETYSYKGISAGKYVEGSIEALSQEEASFKLKEQKIIITRMFSYINPKRTNLFIPSFFLILSISATRCHVVLFSTEA